MVVQEGTPEIIRDARRQSGPGAFFRAFPDAWSRATHTVLKLETRQEYREPGNPSWEKLIDGNLEEALRLVPAARAVDTPLYESLRQRGVRFLRCRPIRFPLTLYMRGEIACYEFNAAHGEEILFADCKEVAELLQTRARHDFMVFDRFVAFIHEYDEHGEIQGGWQTANPRHILALVEVFEEFKAHCIPYRRALEGHPGRL
jgi:hypothetical protein